MLTSIRKGSKSWLVYGLFGILIVAFAAWGIGDIFSNRGLSKPVLEVGELHLQPAGVRPRPAPPAAAVPAAGPRHRCPAIRRSGRRRSDHQPADQPDAAAAVRRQARPHHPAGGRGGRHPEQPGVPQRPGSVRPRPVSLSPQPERPERSGLRPDPPGRDAHAAADRADLRRPVDAAGAGRSGVRLSERDAHRGVPGDPRRQHDRGEGSGPGDAGEVLPGQRRAVSAAGISRIHRAPPEGRGFRQGRQDRRRPGEEGIRCPSG